MEDKNIVKSMTMQGLLIQVFVFIVNSFHINFTGSEIESVVKAVFIVVGFVLIFIGRARKGDLYIK